MNTNSSSESQILTIDVLKAYDLLRNGQYRYLDVRTKEEFKSGHVDVGHVLNVPSMLDTPEGMVKNPNFLEEVLKVCTKDDYLIVGCQGGGRSLNATIDLVDAERVRSSSEMKQPRTDLVFGHDVQSDAL